MPDRVRTKVSKSIACRRCHARKVKCSGGVPCSGCRQADKVVDCVYPRKARLVKVSEQYIEDLVSENQRLRRSSSRPVNEEPAALPTVSVLAEAPWFVNAAALSTPILVAEASDLAFATRFRQAMSDGQHGHLARVNFPSDEQLLALADAECLWPTPARARLLVRAATNGLCQCYHMVRRSSVLHELECAIQSQSQSQPQIGLRSKSKLWVMFAIGEMYTTRNSTRERVFPGLHYFCKAMNALRIVSERPSVDMVELHLLLSVYSLFLNRRHTAYTLAGAAVRLATIMGLHLNIPETQLRDAGEREHRNRIWWTAYTLERMWAAKLGYPPAIEDNAIEVDLPSNLVGLDDNSTLDFPDHAYFIARIGLARLSSRIIHSIYGHKADEPSLSRRVQDAFGDLRGWLKGLPPALQIDAREEGSLEPKVRSLHLLFNQLAIIATRPILLHVLRAQLEARSQQPPAEATIPASATALSETCTRCARHSVRLLTDSWTNGTFTIFDYFYTQYLFSAATVLGISTLLDRKERQCDEEQFEVATGFLLQLQDSGNYAAAEFYQHIEAALGLMETTKARLGERGVLQRDTMDVLAAFAGNGSSLETTSAAVGDFMTAGTALSEPLLQELLSQPLPDLEFIDSSMYLGEQQGFYWPGTML
ncbi:fungal-specific transcription factor domain-containing protein [Aspergillus karnatakaensis]|uniref:transcription factor domain-containing protein n=1 Tax=Aspergillus karnatakaensis TaxID=1810916 RepID=UPI003CCE5067